MTEGSVSNANLCNDEHWGCGDLRDRDERISDAYRLLMRVLPLVRSDVRVALGPGIGVDKFGLCICEGGEWHTLDPDAGIADLLNVDLDDVLSVTEHRSSDPKAALGRIAELEATLGEVTAVASDVIDGRTSTGELWEVLHAHGLIDDAQRGGDLDDVLIVTDGGTERQQQDAPVNVASGPCSECRSEGQHKLSCSRMKLDR